ncbi:PEP-CTERM sorting domain-containing protein [Verrucomicrobiaceae bacterium 227]
MTFDVAAGLGLPVDLLSSSSVQITDTAGGVGSLAAGGLLNALGILTLGEGSLNTGTISFTPSTDLNSLDVTFAASPVAQLGLLPLGGSEYQPMLTFSGMSVEAVPEPSSAMLLLLAGLAPLVRRRR